MECKICGKPVKNFIGLSCHIRYKHNDLGVKGYYDLFFKKENEDKCGNPNCNNLTNFCGINGGYQKHCCLRCIMLDPVVAQKNKNTLMKNHGVEHALQSPEILKKMEDGNLIKYGKKNVQQVDEFKEKIKNTCLEIYGVSCSILTDKAVQNNPANKIGKYVSPETCEKLRIVNTGKIMSDEFKEKRRKYMLNGGAAHCNSFVTNPSKPQVELFNRVKELYPSAILNYPCYPLNFSLDVAIPELMICFESDGTYWHQDNDKDLERQKQIEELGWKVIRYYPVDSIKQVPTKEELQNDIKIIKGEF